MTLADALSPGLWAALPGAWAAFILWASEGDLRDEPGTVLFLAFFPLATAALARLLP